MSRISIARTFLRIAGVIAVVGTSVFVASIQSSVAYATTCQPYVYDVSPGWGYTTGGASVTLAGCGFSGVTAVEFGFSRAPSFHVLSDTTMTATTPPAQAAGPVAISVVTPLGRSSGGGRFTYYNPGPPAPCTAVILSASPASPQTAGNPIRFTAVASGCPNPEYRYWDRPSTSTQWIGLQDFSPPWIHPFLDWSTYGKSGSYVIRVSAEDISPTGNVAGGGGYELGVTLPAVEATIPYTVNPATCSGATLQVTPPSPQDTGTKVILTANATGCFNYPVFEFWIRPESSSAWTMVQSYRGNTTYTWDTSGLSGPYDFSVWAKDAASATTDFDAQAALTYQLVGSCAGASLKASPSSPQTAGTSVSFTASSTGCSNPLYEFWMQASTSSNWTMVQRYSTNKVFNWDTSGKPGQYTVGIWVKDSSSRTATFDKSVAISYTVDPAPSPSAEAATSTPAPAPPASSISRTGGQGSPTSTMGRALSLMSALVPILVPLVAVLLVVGIVLLWQRRLVTREPSRQTRPRAQ